MMNGYFIVDKLIFTKIEYPYYIYNVHNPFRSDIIIEEILNMNYVDFINYLAKKFNGINKENFEAYFKTKENAQNAADWINSMIVMNKLVGDK